MGKSMHSQGEWGEFTTTTTYDFILPAFVTGVSGTTLTTNQKVDRWLATSATGAAASPADEANTVAGIDCGVPQAVQTSDYGLAWGGFNSGLSAAATHPDTDTSSAAHLMGDLCTITLGTSVNTASAQFGQFDLIASQATIAAGLTANYEYVSQCSNRGSCDSETGLCKCYAGYTNDNCDTQTAIL